jgi:hypothetical protein
MVFTDDNIENIAKATGLTEDELASLIIAKENEGWTNAEIAEMLVSNFDNKEYAGKGQNELDAIQSLGFNPPKDYNPTGGKSYQQWQEYKEDPSLFDRFTSWYGANKEADEQRRASEREAIANSVNDWRDSHPEQWRVGMVNSIFGDNSMLSQYYAAENAAKESEKNRQNQSEYNQYLKEYDRANAQKEQDAAYKKELKDAEVEMASLNRDLVKADAPEAAVIMKRQESLIAKYPELSSSNDEAIAKQKEEEEYQTKKIGVRSAIPTVFADENAINTQIANVIASDIRPQDKEELVKELQSKKSTAQLAREASQSAVAGHSGKKTTESLDDADLAAKTIKKITAGKGPSSMTDAERTKAKELGYRFRQGKWSK